MNQYNDIMCRKCGQTVAQCMQKYCGDGSDKDFTHRWESVFPSYRTRLENGDIDEVELPAE